MERDVVDRLESLWQAYGYGIALEAAAEIKRLRQETEVAKYDAERLAKRNAALVIELEERKAFEAEQARERR